MSDIVIEGKNLKDIDQSNFQSVGPYTNPNETQVKEPWQGRYKLSGSEDTDLRFDLGTYTDNERGFWEIQTTDPNTRLSQFESKDLQTARVKVVDGLAVSDEVKWSVDTFPFVTNEDDKTIPLYFYYDDELHPSEYNAAVNGKINLKIELRESGRNQNGIIDNFLERDAIRPFVLSLNINQYGTEAGGELLGAGAFVVGDRVVIEANPNVLSYFEQWSGAKSSTSNPYYFDMPKEDIEIIGNFRPNPIINIVPRGDGSTTTHEGAAKLWVGTQDELTNSYLDIGAGLGIKIINDDYFYFETEFERQTLKPGTDLIILHKKFGDEYEFENYSYIGNDGEEVILEDEDPVDPLTNKVGKIGRHNMLSQPEYPEGILQIYANFSVLLFYVRSINNWFLSENSNQSTFNKQSFILTFGYGDGEPTFNASTMTGTSANGDGVDWFVMPLDSLLNMKIDKLLTNDIPGYGIGEWFWWQNPVSGSFFGHYTIENDKQEFDDTILESLTDDDVGQDDGVSLRIRYNNLMESEVADQITGTKDAFTYIGYKFTQLGTYVKITKTEDSHNFVINAPDDTNVIRNKEDSPELDANMYQLGANLQWSFTPNLNFNLGQVGEMPTIQSIVGWDDNDKIFDSRDSSILSAFNMTYNQDGNSMRLTYNPPNSIDDDLYIKYFEFVMKSTIVPPPLLEFLGIFELLFQSNNDGLGTVSLLEEAVEIPQTTYIGKYGQQGPEPQDGDDIETPTYAHTLGEWINGDYNPSGLNINTVNADAQVGILTAGKHPTFDNVIEEILGYDYFSNWVTTGRNFALLNNIGSYLNLQITDNNSLSITPEPNNNSSINDDIEEFLSFVNQNRDVPRIPIRINAFFVLIRTININRLVPGRWTTNWDQAAYEANPGIANVDTWIDDSRIDSAPTSSDIQDATITVPDQFFNGTRELIIRVGIAPSSGADGPNPLITGASDVGLNIEEISAFQYNLKITGVSNSFNIALDWNGLV